MSEPREPIPQSAPGNKHGGGHAHEDPAVKLLVEKAGAAGPGHANPPGAVKTGGDVGGGGTSRPSDGQPGPK